MKIDNIVSFREESADKVNEYLNEVNNLNNELN